MPNEIPKKIADDPIKELSSYINDLDYAIRNDLIYSPTFHPWSIAIKDPKGFVIDNLI